MLLAKSENKTEKQEKKTEEKCIELEPIKSEVLTKNQKLKQDLLSSTSITLEDKSDTTPRRKYSEIIASPREVEVILQRKNTFPKTAYHQEEKPHEWKYKDDEIFVEPPVATVSSFAIGQAVPIPNQTLKCNDDDRNSKKKEKPKLEIKVPSLKSIPWVGLITNMGTISMYLLYIIIYN